MRQALAHLAHHRRFYSALALGLGVGMVSAGEPIELRLVFAADAFFAAFLLLIAPMLAVETPATIRARAEVVNVGNAAVLGIVVLVIVASLAAIFEVIGHRAAPNRTALLALAGVPLGWLTLHSMAALRYAHQYYQRAGGRGRDGADARGLEFSGGQEPAFSDFFYFAFTVGMTAQTSDVGVSSVTMRRLVLVHGVVSFFFNAVILALAVSVAYGLAA